MSIRTSSLARKLAQHDEGAVLVLQGGGALGAYQAGVFEELSRIGVEPNWVAGVSIGAINAALIAGNPPEKRLERLREFWDLVTSAPASLQAPLFEGQRATFNQWSAAWAATFGVPGFYRPRVPPPALAPDGTPGALSVYDTADLRATLERLIDFDRINDRVTRLSVGTVDVASGNSKWFDNTTPKFTFGPEHVMASGALPPAFAPVIIDDRAYWDGGIVSNTPLQYVLDNRDERPMLVVQVDLFPALGTIPLNLPAVLQRHKDIMYSSRSRYTTEKIAEMQRLRGAMRRLIRRLPAALRDDPDVRALDATLHVPRIDIVHLIYRTAAFERESKDYEFSRPSMLEHWAAGVVDMRRTHENPELLEASSLDHDVKVYDLAQGYDAAPKTSPDQAERVALRQASRALDNAPANGASAPPRKRAAAVRKKPVVVAKKTTRAKAAAKRVAR